MTISREVEVLSSDCHPKRYCASTLKQLWCPRDSAQDLAKARAAHDLKTFRRRQGRRAQLISDRDQSVRIRALVSATADRRSDSVDSCEAVVLDDAGDIAKSVGLGRPRESRREINSSRVSGDIIRHAEAEPILQNIGELPGTGGRIEGPLLKARGR